MMHVIKFLHVFLIWDMLNHACWHCLDLIHSVITFKTPTVFIQSEVLRGALSKTSRKIQNNFSVTHQN